jgi:hypothetical protein
MLCLNCTNEIASNKLIAQNLIACDNEPSRFSGWLIIFSKVRDSRRRAALFPAAAGQRLVSLPQTRQRAEKSTGEFDEQVHMACRRRFIGCGRLEQRARRSGGQANREASSKAGKNGQEDQAEGYRAPPGTGHESSRTQDGSHAQDGSRT